MAHKKNRVSRASQGDSRHPRVGRKRTNLSHLKLQLIRRKEVQQSLAVVASFAVLLSGCYTTYRGEVPVKSSNKSGINASNAEDKIDAVFYENTQQCETDTKKQQDEYQVLLKAHEKGELSTKPQAPALKPEDCAAQIQAAQEEYDKNSPVYDTLVDCQAEGVRCENTPTGYYRSGYRPVFGGTYFYPYYRTEYVYVYRGGTRHRVYRPRTVYRGKNTGSVVTPYGRTINRSSPGRVKAPRHTTAPAPRRPKGTAARGTIKGRSSKGFGSTFRSTGRGGK